MSFAMGLATAKRELELDPPITPEESVWWSKERYKVYRATTLRFGLPFFVVFALSSVLTRPEKLAVLIPLNALLVFGMSLVQARVLEGTQRTQAIRSRRIRESILADSTDAQP